VRFVVDAQLPPALAVFLRSVGHEASHVEELGLTSASDRAIWDHAVKTGSVIAIKVEDSLTLRALRSVGPSIVWVRIGNTTREELLRIMKSALPEIMAALERGERVVEVISAQAREARMERSKIRNPARITSSPAFRCASCGLRQSASYSAASIIRDASSCRITASAGSFSRSHGASFSTSRVLL